MNEKPVTNPGRLRRSLAYLQLQRGYQVIPTDAARGVIRARICPQNVPSTWVLVTGTGENAWDMYEQEF